MSNQMTIRKVQSTPDPVELRSMAHAMDEATRMEAETGELMPADATESSASDHDNQELIYSRDSPLPFSRFYSTSSSEAEENNDSHRRFPFREQQRRWKERLARLRLQWNSRREKIVRSLTSTPIFVRWWNRRR